MTESSIVITAPHGPVESAALGRLEADAIVLTAEERRWGRRRVRTRRGRVLQLALPTGSHLAPGEILYVGDSWYVRIEPAPEPVLVVTPASFEEAIRIAFEVGNRHFTLALDGAHLLVPDDPAMTHLLGRLGIAYDRLETAFVPLGFAHRHDP